MGDAPATIYRWGGGREAFARWLNRFYDLVELEAPEVAAMFGGDVSEEHRAHVTAARAAGRRRPRVGVAGRHRRACPRPGRAGRRCGEEVTDGQIPFTPRAKKVLELALREALSLGHNYIGPEHIPLGLVSENEGVAARILLDSTPTQTRSATR